MSVDMMAYMKTGWLEGVCGSLGLRFVPFGRWGSSMDINIKINL